MPDGSDDSPDLGEIPRAARDVPPATPGVSPAARDVPPATPEIPSRDSDATPDGRETGTGGSRWLVWLVAIAVVAVVVGGIGVGIGHRFRPLSGSTSPALGQPAVPGGEGESHEQVTVGLASDDVPGCYAAGEAFGVTIHSTWRAVASNKTINFVWNALDDTNGQPESIIVTMGGQSMMAQVRPGGALPQVDLTLPVDPVPLNLKVDTLLFEQWNAEGKACFSWVHPVDTPREYDAEPVRAQNG